MNHLTADQLSARLDGALTGRALEEADQHLAECQECQIALARLGRQDADLKTAVSHDPGEPYFETFPARVEVRLRAAGLRGAQARGSRPGGFDLASWFRSPRKLALVGAVATVVAGAGIVLIASREVKVPTLEDQKLAARGRQVAAPVGGTAVAPVPSASEAEPKAGTNVAARPGPAAGERQPAPSVPAPGESPGRASPGPAANAPTAQAARAVAPGHVVEVRRGAGGEEIVPQRPGAPTFASPPPPPAGSVEQGEAVRYKRSPVAQPLQSETAKREALKPATPGAAAPVLRADAAPTRTRRTAPTPAAPPTVARDIRPVPAAEVPPAIGGRQVEATAPFSIAAPPGSTVPARPLREAAEPRDAFSALPDTLRAAARRAQALSAFAARVNSAAGYDAAALEWERLLRRLEGGPAELEARFRLAEARFHAWQLNPGGKRMTQAVDALTAFVVRAPTGPQRDQAARWLDQVKR